MNKVLLKYELLALLRDTRTIFASVLLPIVLLPALIFTMEGLNLRASGEKDATYHYGRVFPSPGVERVTRAALDGDVFREMLVEDGRRMLKEGHLDLLIQVQPPEREDRELAEDIIELYPSVAELIEPEPPGQPIVEISYRSDKERSVRAYLRANRELLSFRNELLEETLRRNGGPAPLELATVDASNARERAARRYGPALSAFMVLILLGGGSVAALDSLAGERERGTLATLFVSSLERRSIAWTKFAAVTLISVAVAVIQIMNLGAYAVLGIVEWPLQTGWGGLSALSLLFVAEAIFTAALLLYISARSTSFKEAQLFFFPTFMVAFALSVAGLMPALVSRSVVSLIPLTGPGVFIPEILAGQIDPAVLLVQCTVHLVGAYALLRSTIHRMEREDFLGGEPPQYGEALKFEQFSQRVLPAFALLVAALFVVPSNFAALSGLTGQVLFNQLILFLLCPYLLLRYFGQDVKKVVPVRRVEARIVLVCLALIPLGQLAATGLSHLLGPLLPAPVKALEMMMELLDLESTPPWQLFLLIGVLPGVCEEFAFRGVLLHALHKRFHPWLLALMVALVFGLFHLNFFRVLPTAYLGFFMALLTLATGSVLPAVIVHIGNNSLAVWAMLNGWDFEGLSGAVYGAAFAGQLLLVGLVLRWGRGYPGTLWEKRSNGSA